MNQSDRPKTPSQSFLSHDQNSFGPNREAAEKAISALQIEDRHAALVQAVRTLADVVDGELAPNQLDKVWREYRQTLQALMEATSGGSTDGFDIFLRGLRAKVSDPEDAGA